MKPTLTAIVLTHNDEKRIVDCLECLTFADEIIVVDDESEDRTVELTKRYTNHVHSHPLNGNFASQRNFALNLAHGNWILFVDSDELVTKNLQQEIINVISKNSFDSFFLKRLDYMWKKRIEHGEGGSIRLVRLAKKGNGKWHGKVHEVWRTSGEKGTLAAPLIHIPHQSVAEFVNEVDNYSTLRAEELKGFSSQLNFIGIILYPVGKFFVNYFLKSGYKDGIPGFIYAMLMSFHSFLVRAKLKVGNNDRS